MARKSPKIGTAALALLLLAAACSSDGDAAPTTTLTLPTTAATTTTAPTTTAGAGTHALDVVDFAFPGGDITVGVGDTVEWTWDPNSFAPHTVTSGSSPNPDGIFDSGVQTQPTSFSFTFTEAGTFAYFCQVHPQQMTGTITVTS